jgi:acyl-CoA thioester hydrolase
MYTSETKVRVRYAETDRMGYVYNGNYAMYAEVGRVEALRQLDVSYRDMEDNGIILPVLSLNVKFIRPAYYDELLTIKTTISELPETRMHFNYEIFNEKGELLTICSTEHVFVIASTKRPCKAPEWLLDKLRQKI